MRRTILQFACVLREFLSLCCGRDIHYSGTEECYSIKHGSEPVMQLVFELDATGRLVREVSIFTAAVAGRLAHTFAKRRRSLRVRVFP